MVYQVPKLFPSQKLDNLVICLPAFKAEVPLLSCWLPDLHLNGDSQCFPLYYYEPKKRAAPQLPGLTSDTLYERKDAITDFIHGECKALYGLNVTKEDIFYYVYGLLHSSEYCKTFANDLKKSLPKAASGGQARNLPGLQQGRTCSGTSASQLRGAAALSWRACGGC